MSRDCFIICPIGDPESQIRERSNTLSNYIIEPIVSQFGYTIDRADISGTPGSITSQIIDRVCNAELVIADLTDHNPNVFYELAIRHTIGKPYIQMAQLDVRLPFDVKDQRTVFYDVHVRDAARAKGELQKAVEAINSPDYTVESPITNTVDLNTLRASADVQGRTMAQIVEMLSDIRNLVVQKDPLDLTLTPWDFRRLSREANIPLHFLNSERYKVLREVFIELEEMKELIDPILSNYYVTKSLARDNADETSVISQLEDYKKKLEYNVIKMYRILRDQILDLPSYRQEQ